MRPLRRASCRCAFCERKLTEDASDIDGQGKHEQDDADEEQHLVVRAAVGDFAHFRGDRRGHGAHRG